MKKLFFGYAATIASLYMIFSFKVTPLNEASTASTTDESTTDTSAAALSAGTVTTSTTAAPRTSNTVAPRNSGTAAPPTTKAPAATGGSGNTGGAAASGKKTFNGESVSTDYGTVQVSITVENGKIVAVNALKKPSGSISANAVPKLQQQTLSAQGSDVDGVSGATATTNGWKKSLNAALKTAGIA
jgi:uncharacterized protein with FMN-binding domain